MTQSFEQFVAQQLPRLLRFAGVLTGERQLGEDVVQEVLIRAHRRWDHIGGLTAPEAYVRRMIVNEFVSWRRKWARITPRAVLEDLDSVPDHAVAHAARDELAIQLRALPPKQRAAVVMRYYAGLPDAEIAKALGCGQGTVRSHISRALAAMRINAEETVLVHKEA